MASDEKWYFTKEQLESTPSRQYGIDAQKELFYRQQAAYFIQEMGQRLRVTQLCINTASVYMHRFYVFHSFTHFPWSSIAAAALFLATKVEEQQRKLEHVIRCHNICKNPRDVAFDVNSERYQQQSQDLVFNENILLQTLGFDVAIDHPHAHVVRCCQLVRASKDLAQTSYFMASTSLHITTMCLQYRPTVVACFCIHLACKWSNWEIPLSNERREWFSYVDTSVTTEILQQLTEEFLAIFGRCPSRLKEKIMAVGDGANINRSFGGSGSAGGSGSGSGNGGHSAALASEATKPSSSSSTTSSSSSASTAAPVAVSALSADKEQHSQQQHPPPPPPPLHHHHHHHHHRGSSHHEKTSDEHNKPHRRMPHESGSANSTSGGGSSSSSSNSNSQQQQREREYREKKERERAAHQHKLQQHGGASAKPSSQGGHHRPPGASSVDPKLRAPARISTFHEGSDAKDGIIEKRTHSEQHRSSRPIAGGDSSTKQPPSHARRHDVAKYGDGKQQTQTQGQAQIGVQHNWFNMYNKQAPAANAPSSLKSPFAPGEGGSAGAAFASQKSVLPKGVHNGNTLPPTSANSSEMLTPAKKPSMFSPEKTPPRKSAIKPYEQQAGSGGAKKQHHPLPPQANHSYDTTSKQSHNKKVDQGLLDGFESAAHHPPSRPEIASSDYISGACGTMQPPSSSTVLQTQFQHHQQLQHHQQHHHQQQQQQQHAPLPPPTSLLMGSLPIVNGIETNPTLISNLLKEAPSVPHLPTITGTLPEEFLANSGGTSNGDNDNDCNDVTNHNSGASSATAAASAGDSAASGHKDKKKKSKEKHKHKDKNREDKEKKRKHKDKDKDREKHKSKSRDKERLSSATAGAGAGASAPGASTSSNASTIATAGHGNEEPAAAPIKITISKDKIQPPAVSPSGGLKIKIPKDKIKTDIIDPLPLGAGMGGAPGIKIKISKDAISSVDTSATNSSLPAASAAMPPSLSSSAAKKRPTSDVHGAPPSKASRYSHSHSRFQQQQNGRSSSASFAASAGAAKVAGSDEEALALHARYVEAATRYASKGASGT